MTCCHERKELHKNYMMKEFYNNFTYPFSDAIENSEVNGETIFLFLDAEMNNDGFAGKKILDVGCGTGNRSIDIARKFPLANIVGIDFSEKSIELANIQKGSMSNIEFICSDFLTYPVEEQYDFVISMGVVHHLPDPLYGVQKMRSFLKDDGVCILWLYHTYGEYDRLLKRQLLSTLLGEKFQDKLASVALLKEMDFHISSNRYGNGYGNYELSDEDALTRDADAFLNPLVTSFDFVAAFRLMQEARMDWCSIFQICYEEKGSFINLDTDNILPWEIDMDMLLKSPRVFSYYKDLDNRSKLHAIEALVKPTGFTVAAGKNRNGELPLLFEQNKIDFI